MATQHAETTKKAKTTLPISYLAEAKKKNLFLPSASLHLLKKQYESKLTREPISISMPSSISCSWSRELSAVDIVKMARETIAQCNYQNSGEFSFGNSGLLPEKFDDFELALLLQAAAINFSNQQFDHARILLSMCQTSASSTGNPVQRVVYYFTEALQDRIIVEMGGEILQEIPQGNQKNPTVEEAFTSLQPGVMECHNKLPFCRITQFTAIQAILDNVASSKRIHLIDLGIKSGSHWPILMQALAGRHECLLELLKITAVGSSKKIFEEIGKKLSSFAESLNIPFSFKIVISDLKNLDEDLFELAADEAIVVYSELCLATLLAWPHHLESVTPQARGPSARPESQQPSLTIWAPSSLAQNGYPKLDLNAQTQLISWSMLLSFSNVGRGITFTPPY